MRLLSKRLAGAIAVILFGAAGMTCVLAASTNVTVGPGALHVFSPANVTINVGDQVIWTWASTFHSTTSGTNGIAGDDNGVPGGLWNSGVIISTPHGFTNTFNAAGNYSYFCSVHYTTGMSGMVSVATANLTPTVFITNPLPGSVFAAPATVAIQATASEDGGTITNVQFLVGLTILTNETAAPYSATTTVLTAGSYTLTAIASDGGGVTATSSVPISVVTPVTVALTQSSVFSGTNFQFSYAANVGLSYVIQRSSNLAPANWISLATNVAASNPVVFMDRQATNTPVYYYRVGRMPNR
jgi:plastocyanin